MSTPSFTPEQEKQWPPPQGAWSYEDYARLPDNGMRYEVIEGNLYMSPAPRPLHQEASMLLSRVLSGFVIEHNLGKVYAAPIDVILPDVASPVQPDLVFIAKEQLDIVQDTHIEGVPSLIVEILSPGSERHDRHTKFHAYARAGVPEYWIADPHTARIEVYVLRGQAYVPLGTFGGEATVRSEVLADLSFAANSVIG